MISLLKMLFHRLLVISILMLPKLAINITAVMELKQAQTYFIVCGSCSIGHIRCRGLSKLEGFFNASGRTSSLTELFRDNWYYPSDMASFDSDG